MANKLYVIPANVPGDPFDDGKYTILQYSQRSFGQIVYVPVAFIGAHDASLELQFKASLDVIGDVPKRAPGAALNKPMTDMIKEQSRYPCEGNIVVCHDALGSAIMLPTIESGICNKAPAQKTSTLIEFPLSHF